MSIPRKRHTLQIITLVALVLATTALFIPLEEYLRTRMVALRAEIVHTIEEAVRRPVTYESISPSILRYVEVRGLTIHGQFAERDDLIRVSRMKVYYRISKLLFGDIAETVRSVRLENTHINIERPQDDDLLRLFTGKSGTPGDTNLPELDVIGRNLSVSYVTAEHRLEAEKLSFELGIAPDGITVNGSTAVSYRAAEGSSPLSRAEAELDLRGRFTGTRRASGTVHLTRLTTPLFGLRDQTVQIIRSGGRLEVRKVQDDAPANISFVADTDEGSVSATFLAERLVPADLITFNGPMEVFSPWLQGAVSGEAQLSYSMPSGALDYRVDLGGALTHPRITEQVTAQLNMSGDRTHAAVSELALFTDDGSAAFSGSIDLTTMYPRGSMEFRSFAYGPAEQLSGTISVGREGSDLVARGERVRYGSLTADELVARLSANSERIVTSIEIGWDGENQRSIRATARIGMRDELRIHAIAQLQRFQASVLEQSGLLARGSIPRRLTGADVSGRIAGSFENGELTVRVPMVSIAGKMFSPDDVVAFSGSYEGNELEVREINGSLGGEPVAGEMRLTLHSRNTASFSSDVRVGEQSLQLSGSYLAGRHVTLSGNHGTSARLTFLDSGNVVLQAATETFPLPMLGDGAILSARARGVYSHSGSWNVELDELSVEGVDAGLVSDAAFRSSGSIGPDGMQLTNVTVQDGYSLLHGEGELSVPDETETERAFSGRIAVNAESSEEGYTVTFQWVEGALETDLRLVNSPLRRLGIKPLRGVVNGSLSYSGAGEAYEYQARFSVENGVFNTDSFTASGQISGDPASASVVNGSFTYLSHRLRDISLSLGRESGRLTMGAVYEDVRSEYDTAFDVSMSLRFDGDAKERPLSELPFAGEITLDGVPTEDPLGSVWEFSVSRQQSGIQLRGGPQDSIRGAVDPDGRFTLALDRPLPVQFEAEGTLNEGEIETTVANLVADVEGFPTLFNWNSVAFESGTIEGSLRIVGAINDPDLYGTLTARRLTGSSIYVPETLGPTRSFFVFQEKILEIRETEVPAGDARGTFAGTMILNRWVPEEYEFTITSSEEAPVHVAHNFGGVVVDGHAVGTLTIYGTRTRVDVSGDVRAWNTSITIGEAPEPTPPSDLRYSSTVDLEAETGSRVEFSWPTRDFPVIRAIAQTGESLTIQADTDAETFSVQGDVGIQGGEIYYFDRSFYIREGEILFNEDEHSIDPRISVRAELREMTSEGSTQITLAVDNTRLSQFSPRFESSPPLSDAEIAAILGRGIVSTAADSGTALSTAVRLPSDLALQFGLINSFENRVRDTFNLDLFSVRTQVFQRLAFGALQGGTYPLDNTAPSLGEYLDNTTVFMGKYLGSDLFLELLVQLRSSNPLTQDIQRLGGLEVDSEVSIEWQTPFFLLDWNFFPRNPESLFVTDNTFEFSWEFSY